MNNAVRQNPFDKCIVGTAVLVAKYLWKVKQQLKACNFSEFSYDS